MWGSSESASDVRCACNVVGEVNVNADDGGCGVDCDCGCDSDGCSCREDWRVESIAAWSGSSSEMSMSDSKGMDVGIEGAGGGGMVFDDEAIASHAAFSSSSLLPSQYSIPFVTLSVPKRTI